MYSRSLIFKSFAIKDYLCVSNEDVVCNDMQNVGIILILVPLMLEFNLKIPPPAGLL